MGLGTCAEISLASARQIAEECRKQLKRGSRPDRGRARRPRLLKTAAQTSSLSGKPRIDTSLRTNPPGKMRSIVSNGETRLAATPFPIIGHLDVAAITTDDILRVLGTDLAEQNQKPRFGCAGASRTSLIGVAHASTGTAQTLPCGEAISSISAGAQEEGDRPSSSGHAPAGHPRVYGDLTRELCDFSPRP